MKNKVDVGKLIEKKYKANTLELKDILEQIDLVLNETIDYKYNSKIDTGNLEETDPGNARSIAYHNGAPIDPSNPNIGAPRHEIPGNLARDPQVPGGPKSIAFNIAEAEKDPYTPSITRQRTVKVPDLFSMITDPKRMSVGTPDRDLINNIIENIGLSKNISWRQRIDILQEKTLGFRRGEQDTDITSQISAMIVLNLFKKLAFFMDQPGKQFEYLFAPFIHPDAAVVGDEDTEIADVAYGGIIYSLKFLTSKDLVLKGSLGNLITKMSSSNKNYIPYIVARVVGNGVIEFGEFGVTNDLEYVKNNYLLIEAKETEKKLYYLFESKKTGTIKYLYLYGYTIEQIKASYGKENVYGTKFTTGQSQKYNIGGLSFATKDFKKLNAEISGIETSLSSYAREKQKNPRKSLEQLNKANEAAKKFPDFEKILQKNPQLSSNPDALADEIFKFTDNMKSLRTKIYQTTKQNLEENSLLQEEDKEQKEEPSKKPEVSDINIYLNPMWRLLKLKTLNLGNPEDYNKQMVEVASALNNFYIDILDNLDELNNNLTNFLATSSDAQKKTGSQTYADKSIKNAENIKTSIQDIKTTRSKKF